MSISSTHLPKSNKLYKTYINDFDSLSEYYAVNYRSPEAIQAHANTIRQADYPRRQISAILKKQNQNWGSSEIVQQNAAMIGEPESLVVVTGQQVGIFGGPLFILYKALTCIKLAEKLSTQLQKKVIPIFWLAADDDDVAEINQLTVLTQQNTLSPFSCSFDTEERKPVAGIHLTENILKCHEVFADTVFDSEFKGDILSALRDAYAIGQSLPDAFARWLTYLLSEFGLVILNPADTQIRSLAAKIFLQEIENDSPSTMAAMATSSKLSEAGFPVQVPLRPGRFNLFYVDEYRHAMAKKNGHFTSTDGTVHFSVSDFIAAIKEKPEQFSPNVIMRPIVQDSILPNLAYVAGPAEVSYFAQLRDVYEKFNIRMPIIYPRKSVTILEKKIKRVLDKHDLELEDFWGNSDELMTQVVRHATPEGIFEPVLTAKDQLNVSLGELKNRVVSLDATLSGFIDKERHKIIHQLELIEKKIVQASKRQNEILQQQLSKASHSLYPNQKLQERELSYIPFLCKYGKTFIQHLYDELDLENFSHQIIEP